MMACSLIVMFWRNLVLCLQTTVKVQTTGASKTLVTNYQLKMA